MSPETSEPITTMNDALNFVLCPSYHGATLFGLLVNNHSHVTALGDTLPIQEHMDYFCSCRERIEDCSFWQSILQEIAPKKFIGEKKIVPTVPRITKSYLRNHQLTPRIINLHRKYNMSPWTIAPRKTREFIKVTENLAKAAMQLQGTTTFVDGTKEIYRVAAYNLLRKPKKLRVIHLTRDPRAFALSSQINLAHRNISEEQPIKQWNHYHGKIIELCENSPNIEYLRVRYEDLSYDPDGEMAKVFHFLGLEPEPVAVNPREPHHLIGNRMLLEFDGTVALDTRWETELSADRQLEILDKTETLSERFGYK